MSQKIFISIGLLWFSVQSYGRVTVLPIEAADFKLLEKEFAAAGGSSCVEQKLADLLKGKSEAEKKKLGLSIMTKAVEFGIKCRCSPSSIKARNSLKKIIQRRGHWRYQEVVYKEKNGLKSVDMTN